MGVSARKSKKKVDVALHQLVKQGELERVAPGRYGPPAKPPDGRPTPILERMWFTMRALGRFTRPEIVEITGASPDYARQYIRGLRWQGFITAKGTSGEGHVRCAVYQVIRRQVKAPPMVRERFQAGKPTGRRAV